MLAPSSTLTTARLKRMVIRVRGLDQQTEVRGRVIRERQHALQARSSA